MIRDDPPVVRRHATRNRIQRCGRLAAGDAAHQTSMAKSNTAGWLWIAARMVALHPIRVERDVETPNTMAAAARVPPAAVPL